MIFFFFFLGRLKSIPCFYDLVYDLSYFRFAKMLNIIGFESYAYLMVTMLLHYAFCASFLPSGPYDLSIFFNILSWCLSPSPNSMIWIYLLLLVILRHLTNGSWSQVQETIQLMIYSVLGKSYVFMF